MQDKLEKERNDAKNAVEEYVYEMRDKLCGVYEKFVSEDVSIAAGLSWTTVVQSAAGLVTLDRYHILYLHKLHIHFTFEEVIVTFVALMIIY